MSLRRRKHLLHELSGLPWWFSLALWFPFSLFATLPCADDMIPIVPVGNTRS